MSGSYLRIDLDQFGLRAMLIEQNAKNELPGEVFHLLFADIPDATEGQDLFDAGMDIISQQIDLSVCSTAVLFVSSLTVFFRILELPFRSEKKIRQVLPFELEPFLPNDDQICISDFYRIGVKDKNKDKDNLILTASFPELKIKTYVSKLKDLKIKPVIITPTGYAAVVSFLKERKDLSSFLFLYVTKGEYTLVIVVDRQPCMVRAFSTVRYGPDQLATALKQSILGFRQRTCLDLLFDVFIWVPADNPKTKEIFNAIDDFLEYQFGLSSGKQGVAPVQENVSSTSLLSSIKPESRMQYLFNFCRGEYGASSFFKTYFNQIAVSLVLGFILFSLSFFSIHIDILKLDEKITGLDKKALKIYRETFPTQIKVLDPFLEMKANVREALKKAGTDYKKHDLSRNGVRIGDVILELSKRITESIDVDISRFIFNEGRLILSGSTDNFNNVDKIKTGIEGSKMFEKVSISSAAMGKNGNRVNFKFIIEM